MTHSADRAPRTRAAPVRTVAIALFLLVAVVAVGCVYRINIQQGNFLDPKAVEQLTVGMTRSQVRYLLGTPMVPNAFDTDRWDYFFYYKTGRTRKAEQAQIVVYFEDDKVSRIERPRGSAQVATTTHTEKPAKAKEPAEPLPPPPAPPSSTAEQLPSPPASPPPESAPSTPEASESPPPSPPESAPSTPEASESPPPSPAESGSTTPEPTDPSPP
jgi:outer membrane protein assembly factor BamE